MGLSLEYLVDSEWQIQRDFTITITNDDGDVINYVHVRVHDHYELHHDHVNVHISVSVHVRVYVYAYVHVYVLYYDFMVNVSYLQYCANDGDADVATINDLQNNTDINIIVKLTLWLMLLVSTVRYTMGMLM